MSRKPRVHFPGALYHVIARGNRLQQIFLDDADYRLYLRFLKAYKVRYRFSLYAYTLMPNHLHLLVEVGGTPLSRLMQSLQFRYTRNFNIKYRKWGHLFQSRYRAILCEKDSYFLELSAYIHLNPVRAGLVQGPEAYPWTSYSQYVKDGNEDGLTDVDFLLTQFSPDKALARQEYASFVHERISQGHRSDFYQLKHQNVLGSEKFVEHIRKSLNHETRYRYEITLGEIVNKVSAILGIPAGLFYTPSRSREGALGRAIAGYMARKLSGCQMKRVGEHFSRDPAVISQGLKKLEQRLSEDGSFARTVNGLENELIKNREKVLI
jgi:REP element-mobilizing transposase RayT